MENVATIARSSSADLAENNRRLRIASVCKLLPTQAEPHRGVFVARRLSHLAALADVQIIQPVPWFPLLRPRPNVGWTADADLPRSYRQPMFYLPGVMKGLDGRWLARSILPVLTRWRDESGIDLIDAHFGYPEGVGAVLAADRLGIPAFITIRGNELVYLQNPSIRGQLLDAFSRARGIIAVSQALRNAIGEAGVDVSKVRVIPNAVDRSQFFPASRDEAREVLNLPLHSPVVVSVGQLVEGKGHHVLVQAVERLRRDHPDVVLIIVGGEAYEKQYPVRLRALIGDLHLRSTVKLVGPQPPDRVAQWLNAADVFALCTSREGCCNAVLEALACGVPVVTTPVGDNEQYVDPPHSGAIVPPENPDATYDALKRALSQTWDRRTISERLGGEGWQGVGQAVLDFFHEQLNMPAQSSGSAT